ncbi:MAG: peptidoglycan editing factor PgeF [Phycisphaerales bacterium]
MRRRADAQVGTACSGGGAPPVLTSPLLGIFGPRHAFSTRFGGFSAGPFDSLNFGNPVDLPTERRDPLDNIRRNFEVLMAAANLSGRELVQVHQVHGAKVHVVHRGERSHAGDHDTKADAIVTDDPERAAAVRVADCAPVLLSTADGRVVAAVHAGWRGVVGGVVVNAVEAMCRLAPAADLAGFVAAIGPCIGRDAFEVGPEVAAEFLRVFGPGTPHVRPGEGDRSLVDLKGALAEQLERAGLDRSRIDVLPHCTASDGAMFFSHRRDRGLTGRMAAIIGPSV